MSNGLIYVVNAHFIDRIEKKISWTQVPVHVLTASNTNNTTPYGVENPGTALGQVQKCLK